MEQLFFAGKAYLKINSLVKTPLHEFMAVERSGLWAPSPPHCSKPLVEDPLTPPATPNNSQCIGAIVSELLNVRKSRCRNRARVNVGLSVGVGVL